jgi:hypothetical protein
MDTNAFTLKKEEDENCLISEKLDKNRRITCGLLSNHETHKPSRQTNSLKSTTTTLDTWFTTMQRQPHGNTRTQTLDRQPEKLRNHPSSYHMCIFYGTTFLSLHKSDFSFGC